MHFFSLKIRNQHVTISIYAKNKVLTLKCEFFSILDHCAKAKIAIIFTEISFLINLYFFVRNNQSRRSFIGGPDSQ